MADGSRQHGFNFPRNAIVSALRLGEIVIDFFAGGGVMSVAITANLAAIVLRPLHVSPCLQELIQNRLTECFPVLRLGFAQVCCELSYCCPTHFQRANRTGKFLAYVRGQLPKLINLRLHRGANKISVDVTSECHKLVCQRIVLVREKSLYVGDRFAERVIHGIDLRCQIGRERPTVSLSLITTPPAVGEGDPEGHYCGGKGSEPCEPSSLISRGQRQPPVQRRPRIADRSRRIANRAQVHA